MLCLCTAEVAVAAEYSLKVKPRLCIVSAAQPACEVQLEARWSAPQPGSYCLYTAGQPQPLQCWNDVAAGRHSSPTTIGAPLLLQLVHMGNGSTVARAEVEVLSENSDDRRRQRRRRHVWSIL